MAFTPKQRAEYNRKRKAFLLANPWCEVALLTRGERVKSTHVHHRRGRAQYFLDESTFVATSREGDEWIHKHQEQARQLGLLE